MTNISTSVQATASAQLTQHPLDPLSAEEITATIQIIRSERNVSERVRFVLVNLHKPPKEVVLNFTPGDPITREAFVALLDNSDGAAYEAVVSITASQVLSWHHVPGVQPPIMLDEFF